MLWSLSAEDLWLVGVCVDSVCVCVCPGYTEVNGPVLAFFVATMNDAHCTLLIIVFGHRGLMKRLRPLNDAAWR